MEIVAVLVGAGVVLAGYLASRAGWVDFSSKKKRAGGGSFLGVVDEVFAPTRHEAALERDRQAVLPAPAPMAGDGDKGIYSGRVTIELDEKN